MQKSSTVDTRLGSKYVSVKKYPRTWVFLLFTLNTQMFLLKKTIHCQQWKIKTEENKTGKPNYFKKIQTQLASSWLLSVFNGSLAENQLYIFPINGVRHQEFSLEFRFTKAKQSETIRTAFPKYLVIWTSIDCIQRMAKNCYHNILKIKDCKMVCYMT